MSEEVRESNGETEEQAPETPGSEGAGIGEERPEAAPEAGEEREQERLQREAREHYERLLRVSADFENYKKRAERERAELIKYANEELLRDFLSVVDNLERAVDHAREHPEAESLVDGVEMILKQFKGLLGKYGVREIEALRRPFDPNLHEAMMHEVVEDHEENIVIDEFQKGYILKDRLLRPAMVKVSKKASQEADVGLQEEE